MTTELIFTLFGAIFTSTGFWAFITTLINNRKSKVSNETKLLKGIAHDRICSLGEKYIQQGWLTRDDYENIYEYLYLPYHDLGGNGSAERIMEEVKRLPLRKE